MTNIFYDLTDKFDKKTVAILSEIDRIAGRLRLVYFIVGATARDILLQYAHNIYATRATVDVDIGVLVSDFYSAYDIEVLQTLADQIAIAVINHQQAQRLRTLYQQNIDRQY